MLFTAKDCTYHKESHQYSVYMYRRVIVNCDVITTYLTGMSEGQADKLIAKHKNDMAKLEETQQDERDRQQEEFKVCLDILLSFFFICIR